jgi:VIT1/CCC1 family predicted Fe2+/Mn2+ transporter
MSLTTALAAKKARYETHMAALSDTDLALEVAVRIERWYAALTALAAEEANPIESYGISGRTVQRRKLTELSNLVDQLQSSIEAALFGGGAKLADCRDGFDGERQ